MHMLIIYLTFPSAYFSNFTKTATAHSARCHWLMLEIYNVCVNNWPLNWAVMQHAVSCAEEWGVVHLWSEKWRAFFARSASGCHTWEQSGLVEAGSVNAISAVFFFYISLISSAVFALTSKTIKYDRKTANEKKNKNPLPSYDLH